MRQPFLRILLAIAACAMAPAHASNAASIVVTTTVDELNTDGDCSLREAIRAANGNVAVDACTAGQNDQTDTITVPAGTYTLTLPGDDNDASAGDLDILNNAAASDVVISGAGAATTIIQACDVDQRSTACPAGHGVADRVLHVRDATVAISGVTIRHGVAPRLNSILPGSGIYIQRASVPATVSLTDVVVTRNGLIPFNGFSVEGGGIKNEYGSHLTLTRVTVSENAENTGNGGAGIFNDGTNNDPGAPATLVMTDSTVRDNTGLLNAGAIRNKDGAAATLTGCTISGNTGGGFVNLSSSTATLTNCTVSGNVASGGAAGISNSGTFDLRSSTVTLNDRIVGPSGPDAGGIKNSNTFVLRNSIVAGNLHYEMNPNSSSPDCLDFNAPGGVTSEGFSVVGDGKHCPGLVDGLNDNQIGTQGAVIDAELGPLADNGGPTLTHALLEGSPAQDAGDPAAPGSGGTACPLTDQRGETRPSGRACDAGSVEVAGAAVLAIHSVTPGGGGNAGSVLARVRGAGFGQGAVARLVRPGFADVIGTTADVSSFQVTTSFDLVGAAPGVWGVRVDNLDASTATLADAFTVVAGGAPDLWSELVLPRAFLYGRFQTMYLQFGNRGNVDALAVPIWISFPDELEFHIPFTVSAPPSQSGQVPVDWTRIAIDEPIPPPEDRDSFPLLLPIVPAGSTGVLAFRVKSPPPEQTCQGDECVDPSRLPFRVSADIGSPYFEPNLSPAVIANYVARAREYVAEAPTTPGVPSEAAIDTYVRTQLAEAVATGRANANLGYASVFSQTQLIVDTGNFIAKANQGFSLAPAGRWLAGVVDDFVGRTAEARLVNPDCDAGDIWCERDDDPAPCPIPVLCCPIPGVICVKNPLPKCDKANEVGHDFDGVPCNPKDNEDRPLRGSLDPNDKVGPGGDGGFVDGVAPLPYVVSFENLKTASGDAFEVTITDQLDVAKYDLATFSLGPVSFGDHFVAVPPGLKTFSTEVDLRPGANILVGIEAALDTNTGVVTWKFTTLDPATHEFPENPDEGFLPPNVTSPEGEGAVLFTVNLKPGFGLGTTVCNDARIVFDFNAPIDTPNFCNTIGAPEDCENCIDDDGDGLVDRADPDCAAPANGAGLGVGDAKVGKAVDKCAKAIRKVGAKLASNRLKQLGACEKAVADCVQLKPGDAACLAKAQGKCTKAKTALPGAEAKLTAAIVTSCGEPAVTTANLLTAAGLGFDGETASCQDKNLESVGTVADVAECVRRQHVCAAERTLGVTVPRARELLVLGGFDTTDFGCLAATANGGGSAIAAEKRKAIRKCDGAIQKAAAKLLAGRTKAGQACAAAEFSCAQTKPNDQACVDKAGATCAKAVAALPKLQAAFASTIVKSCGTPLDAADLLAPEGLGAGGLAASCARLGVPSLASVADVSTCLERQVSCRGDQLLESTTPRLDELLGIGGVSLP